MNAGSFQESFSSGSDGSRSVFRAPTVHLRQRQIESWLPPAASNERSLQASSSQERQRLFERNIVKALWEDTALDHFVTHPITRERTPFLPSVETLRSLQKEFKAWIEAPEAEMRAAMRRTPDRAEEIEERFRQTAIQALHQPLSSVTESAEETNRPLGSAEVLKLRIFALRGLLSGNAQAFSHLDRLFLNGRPAQQLEEAWSEAIDRNELLRINGALGVSALPLQGLADSLAARGLQEEAGVCHPATVTPAEKQADSLAYQRGKDLRLNYHLARQEALERYPEILASHKKLKELLVVQGDLPSVADWAVRVALSSKRYGELEERKAHVERDLGLSPDDSLALLEEVEEPPVADRPVAVRASSDQGNTPDYWPVEPQVKIGDSIDPAASDERALRRSLAALRTEQLEVTLQREAYRHAGSEINFLTEVGALPAHGDYSLQEAVAFAEGYLEAPVWRQRSPDPYEHGSDSTRH